MQKASPDYGLQINPISRLIQIQQAKKEKEPLYSFIGERGHLRRREFIIQVSHCTRSSASAGTCVGASSSFRCEFGLNISAFCQWVNEWFYLVT